MKPTIVTFLIAFFILYQNRLHGQASKLNIDLYMMLQQTPASAYDSILIPALVKGDLSKLQSFMRNSKGTYKYGVKNIASVRLSLSEITQLIKAPFVQRIEHHIIEGKRLNYSEDSVMLQNNNAMDVHAGNLDLPYPYKGDGVLVGVIDDGFEFKHPDFLNDNQGTRILHLWDQTSSNISFFENYYGYGASWAKINIDSFQCTHVPFTHGTHVMGTAVGNARANGKYPGIAPNADIAAVRIGLGSGFLPGFVDAVHYLFQKADALQQACVINSSVGSYLSGHDGLDLYSQLIDILLKEKPGRALVQAGGNARQYEYHQKTTLQNALSRVRFKYHNAYNRTHFNLYADTSDFQQINFSLQCIDPVSQQITAQTSILNILQDFNFSGSVAQYSQVMWYDAQGLPVTLYVYADQYEDSYHLYFSISSFSNVGQWQLTTTGTGAFDIWSAEAVTGSSDILKNIAVSGYQNPDNNQTIVGFWTCLDDVITVASYQNRNFMVNYNNDTVPLYTSGFPKHGISFFSSVGPTRKGILKPNLTAPGGQVMSASTLSFLSDTNYTYLDQGGWHISNRGTSMAAPMVAGAVALYLECKPYADITDIKNALATSAAYDSYVLQPVFAIPNMHWGYGKLDVYELVKSCLIYGCNDTTALNYNSYATVLDTNTCIYDITSITSLEENGFSIYPNPVHSTLQLDYHIPLHQQGETTILNIYNAIGQLVHQQQVDPAEYNIALNVERLASGMYWLAVNSSDKTLHRTSFRKL